MASPPLPVAAAAVHPAVLGTTRTLGPGNSGTEIAQPAARPAVLGATRTLGPGNSGTEMAGI